MSVPILEMKNIDKSFSGVKVLNNVQLSVHPGKVHALMGENGAGKIHFNEYSDGSSLCRQRRNPA